MPKNADHLSYQRASTISAFGLAMQLALAVAMLVYGVLGGDYAATYGSIPMFFGVPIWIALLLVFHQHKLERLEAIETEAFRASDASQASVFDEVGRGPGGSGLASGVDAPPAAAGVQRGHRHRCGGARAHPAVPDRTGRTRRGPELGLGHRDRRGVCVPRLRVRPLRGRHGPPAHLESAQRRSRYRDGGCSDRPAARHRPLPRHGPRRTRPARDSADGVPHLPAGLRHRGAREHGPELLQASARGRVPASRASTLASSRSPPLPTALPSPSAERSTTSSASPSPTAGSSNCSSGLLCRHSSSVCCSCGA